MLSTGHLYFCDINSYLRRLHIHLYIFFCLWQEVQIDTYISIVSYNNLHLQALTASRVMHAKCCFSQSILKPIHDLLCRTDVLHLPWFTDQRVFKHCLMQTIV